MNLKVSDAEFSLATDRITAGAEAWSMSPGTT